jgi:hypothetical protein
MCRTCVEHALVATVQLGNVLHSYPNGQRIRGCIRGCIRGGSFAIPINLRPILPITTITMNSTRISIPTARLTRFHFTLTEQEQACLAERLRAHTTNAPLDTLVNDADEHGRVSLTSAQCHRLGMLLGVWRERRLHAFARRRRIFLDETYATGCCFQETSLPQLQFG